MLREKCTAYFLKNRGLSKLNANQKKKIIKIRVKFDEEENKR